MLFNTDSLDNLDQFREDFAGKMEKYAFQNLFRRYVEEIPHGFLVIDNDPNLPYDQKFFAGVAEIMPFDLDHIVGSESTWKDDMQQLQEIADGGMQAKIDLLSKMSDPENDLFDPRNQQNYIQTPYGRVYVSDLDDRQRPVWDARGRVDGAIGKGVPGLTSGGGGIPGFSGGRRGGGHRPPRSVLTPEASYLGFKR